MQYIAEKKVEKETSVPHLSSKPILPPQDSGNRICVDKTAHIDDDRQMTIYD